jgi:hypothetical protein
VTFEPESAARIAFGTATAILSIVMCASLAVRRLWPSLGVRVVTSVVVLVALAISPKMVLVLMEPSLHRGFDAGVWLHPGLGILVGPAIIAVCLGAVFWRVLPKRPASPGAA